VRTLVVLEHLSLDGVIQGPGGKDEDVSGGFRQGGWISPFGDELQSAELAKRMHSKFDLLLGRKTYDIWAPYWPQQSFWPEVNQATKYVASNTLTALDWAPSKLLSGDVAAQVKALKATPGPTVHLWGSANLLQTLLKHDLVDELFLMVYPVVLGSGKRLFEGGELPCTFELVESVVNTKGLLLVTYRRKR